MRLGSWLPLRRPQRSCALDLDSENATFLALRGDTSIREIELIRTIALPSLDFLNGFDGDRIALTQELRDAVRLLELQGRPLRMSLPGDAVLFRVLELPLDLDDREREIRVLEQEAELYLPFTRSDADLDYFPLGACGEDRQQILLVATRRMYTDRCQQLAQDIGCSLLSLEPRSLVVARALRPLLENLTGGVLLLNLSVQTCELTLFRDGLPLFERVLPYGVRLLLADAYPQIPQLPWSSIVQSNMLATVALADLETALQSLIQEIRRSLDFVRTELDGLVVERMLLCGPGAGIRELTTALGSRLGVRCESPDPWLVNGIDPPAEDPLRKATAPAQLATALGLALKGD